MRPGVSEAVKNKLAESVKIRYWGLRMSWSFTSSATSRCRSNDLPHPSNTLFDSSMIFRFKRRDQLVPPIEGIQLWKEISFYDIAQMCYILFFLYTWEIVSSQGREGKERENERREFLVCISNRSACNHLF